MFKSSSARDATIAPREASSQTPDSIEAPSSTLGPSPAYAPSLNAQALAQRMAAKATRLQRRHQLSEVVRQYIVAQGELLDRDPGRLSTLRMWDAVLGGHMLDEVSSDEVAEALAMYAETPVQRYVGIDKATGQKRYKDCGPRAPSTVTRAKVVLSAVYAFAKDKGLLSRGFASPTREIRGRGFKAAELPDRALSLAEVENLLAHARTAPWEKLYLFVLMALTTGARRGELSQIRGRDLHLDGDEPHAVVGLRRREDERATTKNGAVKIMPLSTAVVAEIKRWGVPKADDLLFPSKRKPDQPFDTASSYRALVKRCGDLSNKRFHDLRHTAGTTFANDGRSESEIAALLGHKTLTMVARYTRVQPHAKARAFKRSTLAFLK